MASRLTAPERGGRGTFAGALELVLEDRPTRPPKPPPWLPEEARSAFRALLSRARRADVAPRGSARARPPRRAAHRRRGRRSTRHDTLGARSPRGRAPALAEGTPAGTRLRSRAPTGRRNCTERRRGPIWSVVLSAFATGPFPHWFELVADDLAFAHGIDEPARLDVRDLSGFLPGVDQLVKRGDAPPTDVLERAALLETSRFSGPREASSPSSTAPSSAIPLEHLIDPTQSRYLSTNRDDPLDVWCENFLN